MNGFPRKNNVIQLFKDKPGISSISGAAVQEKDREQSVASSSLLPPTHRQAFSQRSLSASEKTKQVKHEGVVVLTGLLICSFVLGFVTCALIYL
jgi:hypothetical protein